MVLKLWADGTKKKIEDFMASVRRSLKFLGPRADGGTDGSVAEEAQFPLTS